MKNVLIMLCLLIGLTACMDDNRKFAPVNDNGKIIYDSPTWAITEVKINDSLTVLVAKGSECISIIKK